MIITYFRSSSLNCWHSMCEMQYFINYVLGWYFPAGQKAEQGTIVHKVLEILAGMTKALQDDPNCTVYNDEHVGPVEFNRESLVDTITFLTNEEVDAINKSRTAASIYKHKCNVEYGHFRKGVELTEHIFDLAHQHYSSKSVHKWTKSHKVHCNNWLWMALDYKNGMFDPRLRTIHAAEPFFDIEIDREWSSYEYLLPSGEEVQGKLAIKGTIDLITRLDDDTLEIVDWKTGQRIDWGSNKKEKPKKTFEKLSEDPQLMLYYLAAKHLYPDIKNIIVSIFFIRDGGPFSLCFDEQTIAKMENILKSKFLEIKSCDKPALVSTNHSNMKCKYLCPYSKNSFSESEDKNICHTVNDEIKENGLEYVVLKRTKTNHRVDFYSSPGE